MPRLVIFGNSGSGKSTLAKRLARASGLASLDLDTLAWQPTAPPTRRALTDSALDIERFMQAHGDWVIEGCYADLVAIALPRCSGLVFLNPGIETCIEHARSRPWEPHKYATPEAQDANLQMLVTWIAEYETREDEFSLRAHRALFDGFRGAKRQLRSSREIAAWSGEC